MTVPDTTLLDNARDAAIQVVSLLTDRKAPPTREEAEKILWWTRMAHTKMNEYVCQMTGQSRREK
jgi:oligoribonuclease (3'-5' exoribonuclease)